MNQRSRPLSEARQPFVGDIDDFVIVGRGLIGLAFAVASAQSGLHGKLVANARESTEPSNPEEWDQRVYAISPSSRRFLEALGVWTRLDVKRITPVRDMRVFGGRDDAAQIRFSAYEAGADALAWIVEHRALAEVLEHALAATEGVEVVDAALLDYTVDAELVRVQIHGQEIAARLLIGADGASSKVRELAEIAVSRRSYGETAVVANYHSAVPHRGLARQWFVPEGVVALLPLPNDCLSLVWSAPAQLADELLALDRAQLAARVAAIGGQEVGQLQALGGALGFPLELLRTQRQVGPRVALIGDAAHVIHPLAGQGLNLGFQDAESLIGALRERERFRDCGDAVVLRRFERSRAESVAAMRHATHGLHELFSSSDPRLRRLRGAGMKLLERIPFMKRALIRHAMG